jgi:hypothetical protein
MKIQADIKYISFSSKNNDYLQVREISQYPRPVQGQGHIRVKTNIENNSITLKISLC